MEKVKYSVPEVVLLSFDNITNGGCSNGEAAGDLACRAGQQADGGCGQGVAASTKCLSGSAAQTS